jgi:hypothetical protein
VDHVALQFMLELARKPNSTASCLEQFCIRETRTYVIVMTFCAATLLSTAASATPLNLLLLNPNRLAVETGLTSATSPETAGGDDSSAVFNECEEPGDPSRHVRMLLRVMSGHWGLGITIWLSEHELASATSCDEFARGAWAFAANGAGAGVGGMATGAAGSSGPSLSSALASRSGGPGFEFSDDASSDSDESPFGDAPPAGRFPPFIAGNNALGPMPLFAFFEGSPDVDQPHQEDGNETNSETGVVAPNGLRPEGQATPVPEPGSLVLMGSGLAAAWRVVRQRGR